MRFWIIKQALITAFIIYKKLLSKLIALKNCFILYYFILNNLSNYFANLILINKYLLVFVFISVFFIIKNNLLLAKIQVIKKSFRQLGF